MSAPIRIGVAWFALGEAAFAVDADGAVRDLILSREEGGAAAALERRVAGPTERGWDGRGRFAREVSDTLGEPWRPHGLVLKPSGTRLELAVWAVVSAIPCGATRTYLEVARALPPGARGPDVAGEAFSAPGGPADQRDVAFAAAGNRIEGLIPCHRLVRADGRRSGGRGADLRSAMLAREVEAARSAQARLRAQAERASAR